MQVKTNVKAGARWDPEQHNEAQVRVAGLKVRTGVKAGARDEEDQHNEAQVRIRR